MRWVQLLVEVGQRQPEPRDERAMKLRLDRPDGDITPVERGVGAIEIASAIEQICAATIAPQATSAPAMDLRRQHRCAVDHCRVDHLPPARLLPFDQRGENAADEHHRPAAEIADEIDWRRRWQRRVAYRVERARHRDIVDVMTRAARQRAVLAPARHAPDDQTGVGLLQHLRRIPQPLEHARAKPLDQDIGPRAQGHHRPARIRCLQVERDRAPSPV